MLVHHVHRSDGARAARAEYRGGGFEGEVFRARIEGSVHNGEKSRAGVRVVHGRTEYETVEFRRFLGEPHGNVVEDTFTFYSAASATYAIRYRSGTDEEEFRFDTFSVQRFSHFLERAVGATVFAGTAVYE